MRRTTLTISLALGLIAALVLTGAVVARASDFDPPGPGTVTVFPAACPSTSTAAVVVPGGVYRAMVNELRLHGYSRTQLQAEIGNALVVPSSGSRPSTTRCSQQP
jgi:hypothetical protein